MNTYPQSESSTNDTLPKLSQQTTPNVSVNRSVFQLMPIQDKVGWEFYQQQIKSFWTVGELDFGGDSHDSALLTTDEHRMLLHVLAFFAASDMVVNDRLFLSIFEEAPTAEFRAALAAQTFMETVHSEVYALLIDVLCPDSEQKSKLFRGLDTIPTITAKRNWYLSSSTGSFAQRCIVQLCVEGIHFSSSFAILAWLRKRYPGKFQATCKSNELIMRDEAMHAKMACELYRRQESAGVGLSTNHVLSLVSEAVSLEHSFIKDCFQEKRLWGINSQSLCAHVEHVADYWLSYLGLEKMYNTESQFDWILTSVMESKTNFFEERVTEYQINSLGKHEITFDADF